MNRWILLTLFLGSNSVAQTITPPDLPPCLQQRTCYVREGAPETRFAPVHASQLALLGRGVSGRQSRQSLALACVGEKFSCDFVRFVYYVNPLEVYFIGPVIEVPDPKAMKKTLKRYASETRRLNQKRASPGLENGMIVGSLALFFSSLLVGSAWPVVGLIGVGWLCAGLDGIQHALVNQPVTALSNKNGMDWAANPKPINEKLFRQIVLRLQSDENVFSENCLRQTRFLEFLIHSNALLSDPTPAAGLRIEEQRKKMQRICNVNPMAHP